MASPFLIYFAGIGTVVAALGVGFGGGWMLSSSEPVKERPAIKRENAAKPELPKQEMPPLSSTPVTVRTPQENAVRPAAPAAPPPSAETQRAETPSETPPAAAKSTAPDPAETTGRATPGANWVAMPPSQTTGSAAVATPSIAPVAPITAPLDPPAVQPVIAAPVASSTTVTVRRGQQAEERVVVGREPPSEAEPSETRPSETRPSEVRRDKPKAERKLREADQRRSDPRRAERPKAVIEAVETDDDDEPEVAPPPSPPMRDAGSLRGF